MHDSPASSFIGSEGGSPSCSSSDEFEYRTPSVLSAQCAGNSTVYFTDGLYPNHEMLAGPPYGCGSKDYIIDLMFLESGSGGVGAKLSEARMAARRAEEAGILFSWVCSFLTRWLIGQAPTVIEKRFW